MPATNHIPEAELRTLFALSPSLIGVTGPDERLVDVNGRWTDVLGWQRDELVGQAYTELVHPDDVARTRTSVVELVVPDTQLRGFMNRLRARDGSYRAISWWGYRSDRDGRTYAFGSDVTEHHELATRLTRRENDLVALLATLQRTGVDQRLQVADQIHDGVLQELAAAAIVLDVEDPDDLEHAVGMARSHVLDAAAQVRSVLESITPMQLEDQSLDVALRSIVARAVPVGTDVAFGLEQLDRPFPEIRIHACSLVEALVENVVVHARATRILVRGSCDNSGGVELTVLDDGDGMDIDTALDASPRPGSGSSLRLMQEQVRTLGGSFEVRSAPGAGTAVTFRLPGS